MERTDIDSSADSGDLAALPPGVIKIKFTILGDANLNVVVSGIDFGDLAANFNKGASGAAFGPGPLSDPALVAFAQSHGLMADVPEPDLTGALVVGLVGVLAKRSRIFVPALRDHRRRTL